MQDEILMGAVAVVAVCSVVVARAALRYFGRNDAAGKVDKYFPYAVMAAKWVEEQIPDTYGADEEDPKTAKAVHKLDLFLSRFAENVERFTGDKATDEMKAAAMAWSVELAKRLGSR